MSLSDNLDDSLLDPADLDDEKSSEELLESLNLVTVKQNIISQIEGDISPKRDFLGVVLSKYNTMLDKIEDEEILRQLRWEFNDFINSLLDAIVNHYNLCLDLPDEDSIENVDTLTTLYTFFVTSHEFYAITYLITYITTNQRSIAESMGLNLKGMDVTSQACRRQGLNKYSAAMLSNINDVIDYVSDVAYTGVSSFLDVIDDGDYYVRQIREYFDDQILVGNFIEQYLDEIIDERCSEAALKIRNDVRVKLISEISES